ncbi:MAG TPA: Txe/YoeB family addiction module toxin [Jiangellaceae bacterium]
MLSRADYEALEETAHLLRVPANAKRLIESLQQALSRSTRAARPRPVRLVFTPNGWQDYTHWVTADRTMLKRINRLMDDALRDPTSGIGKPEPMRHLLAGAWSRRITEEHRLVYLVDGDDLVLLQARFHYK